MIATRPRQLGEGARSLRTALAAVSWFATATTTVVAQTAPVVSNVRASQRADASRMVDIYYDLSHDAPCTVWPVISGDGGATWNVPALTLTGDVGHNVAPGTNKHIVWDAGRDIPGVAATMRARVYADAGGTLSNMVFVPAGSFPYQRGTTWVFVNSFFVDKYEVINLRYAEFLNDADPDGTYWNSNMEITRSGPPPNVYYAVIPGRENYPIRFVSVLEAEGYAVWISAREGQHFRLPTEQEWEKAAAWDPTLNKHWLYAFQSDSFTCSSCNCAAGTACPQNVTEVGRYNGLIGTNDAHSLYGCYDMSGNLWERTSGDGSSYPFRGGSWGTTSNSSSCQTTSRGSTSFLEHRSSTVGFRLVLDPN